MNIILGLTGSVASTLYMKLIERLGELGTVDVVVTEKAKEFIDPHIISKSNASHLYSDSDEWSLFNGHHKWMKNDPILHIELRKQASVLVIAPCSANTLAKLANGICDNLLTSIARAWNMSRPFFICPAMNTHMWNHPITRLQIDRLSQFKCNFVMPQNKLLACGDIGTGGLAEIDDIVNAIRNKTQWQFPLKNCSGIPVTPHPGAFKAVRRDNHIHTGVDLYADEGSSILACENGVVVSIEPFTGAKDNSPWWKDTDAVLIEGTTGVICYGELEPASSITIGSYVYAGQEIGKVKRVIKEGRERPEITGWKPSMLHMELYPHGVTKASDGYINIRDFLRDPTPYLLKSSPFFNNSVLNPLTWEPVK